jgi:tripartite-type tricarboxylate transporter receptor subunit TctC
MERRAGAHAGTPDAVVAKLNAEINKALQSPAGQGIRRRRHRVARGVADAVRCLHPQRD